MVVLCRHLLTTLTISKSNLASKIAELAAPRTINQKRKFTNMPKYQLIFNDDCGFDTVTFIFIKKVGLFSGNK
jgi:hypothetical protein